MFVWRLVGGGDRVACGQLTAAPAPAPAPDGVWHAAQGTRLAVGGKVIQLVPSAETVINKVTPWEGAEVTPQKSTAYKKCAWLFRGSLRSNCLVIAWYFLGN